MLSQVFIGSTDFSWVFIGFEWVKLGFTGLNWILPG